MPLIYKPRGPALEYAELAVNLYKGCEHGCKYCFAPNFSYFGNDNKQELFKSPGFVGKTTYNDNQKKFSIKHRLKNESLRFSTDYPLKPRVLMSFTTDPYQPLEMREKLTREAIKIMGPYIPLTILTKSPLKALNRDLELF